jgi:hypothetical protein
LFLKNVKTAFEANPSVSDNNPESLRLQLDMIRQSQPVTQSVRIGGNPRVNMSKIGDGNERHEVVQDNNRLARAEQTIE